MRMRCLESRPDSARTERQALQTRSSGTAVPSALVCVSWVLMLAVGCSYDQPYRLRLHVHDETQCSPYESALTEAIEFWSGSGVDAFDYDGCDVDVYSMRPIFRQLEAAEHLPGYRPYTTALATPTDHVPIYVVDEIRVDEGGYRVHFDRGVALPSSIPYCPSLVATKIPEPKVLAHELGHLLWLDHSSEPNNIMSQFLLESFANYGVSSSQVDFGNNSLEQCNTRMKRRERRNR
ncbi:MAG: matrixin family metalloprotease [Deltaproteobacteria bacterium]|nr:matrixin family metalloprotease [Deltaproteobacteria bacterium]MBK8713238.1 matrixin family metalloprotease [Deltaproteobacteria bacterium]MBP7288915.1 matrixin family metalloprotease [Nannocystaceae bacterium]